MEVANALSFNLMNTEDIRCIEMLETQSFFA